MAYQFAHESRSPEAAIGAGQGVVVGVLLCGLSLALVYTGLLALAPPLWAYAVGSSLWLVVANSIVAVAIVAQLLFVAGLMGVAAYRMFTGKVEEGRFVATRVGGRQR